MFTENFAVEKTQLEKIRRETSKDTTLSKILDIYLVGWPTDKNKLEDCLKPYWTFRDEIHIID